MCHSRQPFNFLLRLGLIALAAANVGHFLIQRYSSMPEGARDAVSGFVQGVAIALMLLGIWRTRRAQHQSNGPRCV